MIIPIWAPVEVALESQSLVCRRNLLFSFTDERHTKSALIYQVQRLFPAPMVSSSVTAIQTWYRQKPPRRVTG